MIDFKKMDEKDFIFVNRHLSNEEDKSFSDFLKNRGKKSLYNRSAKKRKKILAQ